MFDTAPHYGLGLPERGSARRSPVAPATCCPPRSAACWCPPRGAASTTRASTYPPAAERISDFSRSAYGARCRTDSGGWGCHRVDLVLIHDPDTRRPGVAEAYPALAELRSQGVIRAIGVGMNQWQVPPRSSGDRLDVVMLAGRYTLLDQSGCPLDACAERGARRAVGPASSTAACWPPGALRHLRLRARAPTSSSRPTARRDLRAARRAAPAGGDGLPAPSPGGRRHRHRRPHPRRGRTERRPGTHPVPDTLWPDLGRRSPSQGGG